MSKYESSNDNMSTPINTLPVQPELQHNEFGEGYDTMPTFENPISRRSFMALMSASMAVTAAACRRPDHKLLASVKSPEYVIPGLPNHYASVFMHGNVAHGVLVKVREGRPVKVEGNDVHPISGGKSSVFLQATLMNLYDPDRIRQSITGRVPGKVKSGGYSTPANAINTIASAINAAQASGKQTRILLGEHCSPSLAAMCREIETAVPHVKFVVMPSAYADGAALANNALFGMDGEFVADLSKAKVVVSVDSDFLGTDKNALYHTRNFSAGRKPVKDSPSMIKLVTAEATYSLTGMNSDERIKLGVNEFEAFLATLHNAVAARKGAAAIGGYSAVRESEAKHCAEELLAAGESGCVMVGAHLSAKANGIGMLINSMLGSIGAGKVFGMQAPYSNAKGPGIEQFRNELRSGTIGVVFACDVNVMYAGDADLRALFAAVDHKFSYSYYDDETAAVCSINMPSTHQFESWGDTESCDGTLSVQQPLIAPLNEGSLSLGDTLMSLYKVLVPGALATAATYFDYVKAAWMPVVTDEAGWEKALRDGAVVRQIAPPPSSCNAAGLAQCASAKAINGVAVYTTLGYTMFDGTYSNNGWMMECPDPITKHTWENVAMMSKATAEKLNVANDRVITLNNGDRAEIEVPVLIQPGISDGVIVTSVGYGREMGSVCKGYGSNAYSLHTPGTSLGYHAVSVADTGKKNVVARTQGYFHAQHTKEWEPNAPEKKNRDIIRDMYIDDVKNGVVINKEEHIVGEEVAGDKFIKPLTLLSGYEYKGHRWGMVIDTSACTGCNACVVACQSENNIATVGKEQVIRGREMHWMRLDVYYKGDGDNPEATIEPMLCQHCENAPCENVCPVAATTHSPEGLNEMTYNRCVGTRYCLNNCPYKVRRFNFLDYRERLQGSRTPMEYVFNPDVTIRVRGVMEKCTFCVQRINHAKYEAKDKGFSRVPDGDVVTACQEACPASAITFGNMNDPKSAVSQLMQNQRSFRVLEELNVRPSVTYLAKVRNKKSEAKAGESHHG